jgi:UDP-GlcNAc:undecaprenyl-phosphate GlcNAc-1-phosphate transferase
LSDEVRLAAAFLLAAVVTIVATPAVIRLAFSTDFLDRPHTYKGHVKPTPYLGGLALMAGILTGAAVLAWPVAPDILRWALVTSVGLCLLGTVDDRVALGPGIRVLLTSGAAVALWVVDAGWSGLGSPVLDLAITVIWTLGVVNAFNLMDNMDGASSSVGAATGLGIAAIALALHRPAWAAVALAITGASIGFLHFNLHAPAKIFLGDGGSMPLGFLAATLPMTLMAGTGHHGWTPLVACVLLVALPALDTALVIVSRVRRGVPVLSGGRDHLTHRLRTRLKSPRKVAFALALGQLPLSAAGVVLIEKGRGAPLVLIAAYFAIATTAIWRFEHPRWGVAKERTPHAGPAPVGELAGS